MGSELAVFKGGKMVEAVEEETATLLTVVRWVGGAVLLWWFLPKVTTLNGLATVGLSSPSTVAARSVPLLLWLPLVGLPK